VHTAKHFEEKIWALLAIASSGIAMLSDAVRPCHTSHMEMSERCQTYLYRHRKGACTRIIYIKKTNSEAMGAKMRDISWHAVCSNSQHK
jgi:hypothetical protein